MCCTSPQPGERWTLPARPQLFDSLLWRFAEQVLRRWITTKTHELHHGVGIGMKAWKHQRIKAMTKTETLFYYSLRPSAAQFLLLSWSPTDLWRSNCAAKGQTNGTQHPWPLRHSRLHCWVRKVLWSFSSVCHHFISPSTQHALKFPEKLDLLLIYSRGYLNWCMCCIQNRNWTISNVIKCDLKLFFGVKMLNRSYISRTWHLMTRKLPWGRWNRPC